MRPTIKSLTIEIANLTKMVELRDQQILALKQEIEALRYEPTNETTDLESGMPMTAPKPHGLMEALKVTPVSPLWNEVIIRNVDSGWNVYFPKEVYSRNIECKEFLGKLMSRAQQMGLRSWFGVDHLLIRQQTNAD